MARGQHKLVTATFDDGQSQAMLKVVADYLNTYGPAIAAHANQTTAPAAPEKTYQEAQQALLGLFESFGINFGDLMFNDHVVDAIRHHTLSGAIGRMAYIHQKKRPVPSTFNLEDPVQGELVKDFCLGLLQGIVNLPQETYFSTHHMKRSGSADRFTDGQPYSQALTTALTTISTGLKDKSRLPATPEETLPPRKVEPRPPQAPRGGLLDRWFHRRDQETQR